MRRGAEFAAVVVAVLGVGLLGPTLVAPTPRASAQDVPDAIVDALAGQLGGLDQQITQLQTAVRQVDDALAAATAARDEARSQATNRQQVEAALVAQARAYAVQRYMYGSTDSTDLLAFVSALSKRADDAVWGLAALEVASKTARSQADDVAKARAAVDEELASLETDVLELQVARSRRVQQLDQTTAHRAEVALQFEAVVRDFGQATVNGMTTVAYQAYRHAADVLSSEQPGCGLRWELLAAIGKTESNHGAGRLDAFGNSSVSIVGIPVGLDTDGGLLDGDGRRDHAVGPMQFLPSTWERWGADANADGKTDPGNIIDAALAAGRYLCRAAGDLTLTREAGVIRAILAYNPNQTYLRVVGARFEALASDLAGGWFSSANLPEAPPASGVVSNGGTNGRSAPGDVPLPPPPPTTQTEVRIFTATGLAAPSPPPPTEVPGTCLGPSRVLGERTGFLRCQPADGVQGPITMLDPCEAAPYDATLVGCVPDPTAPPVLLRLATPVQLEAIGPAPPYRLLVLDGGDRCTPIPLAGEPDGPPPTTTDTTAPTTGPRRASTTTVGTSSAVAPTSATRRQADASSTSLGDQTATSFATSSSPPSSSGPTSEPAPSTTDATTTTPPPTSAATTTIGTTTTTLPLAERPTYGCASGATVIGPPDTSTPTWTVLVRQVGLADRRLTVVDAYS